jgi:uncharacterized membrane protein YccC
VSLRRAAERLVGAGVGCAVGLGAVQALSEAPFVLAAITVVVVVFMVAFEQYTLAVAIRSALAPLAAFALHGDALAAGPSALHLHFHRRGHRDHVHAIPEQLSLQSHKSSTTCITLPTPSM